MRAATGLVVVAAGAILAFAVSGHPWFFNIQIAGWVIMLTGVAGILLPRRGYSRVRRQLTYRRGAGRKQEYVETVQQRPYLMLNPVADPTADRDEPGQMEPAERPAEPGQTDTDAVPIVTEDVGEEVWDK